MPVRAATAEDVDAIHELLHSAELPLAGVEDGVGNLWVVLDEGAVMATAGVEAYGSVGLLRSLVVARHRQGHGIGRTLCSELEARARARGIEQLYLLTTDAEAFFARLGYATVSRDAAPDEIAGCDEFSTLCPDSAVFMSKRL